MGDPKGFMTTPRQGPTRRPVDLRLMDWKEVYEDFSHATLEKQAGRCMNCGIAFCHQGCPLGNLIPEWNDLVYRKNWREASERLHATNNFPEFTGTLCPAPCEAACVLAINDDAVTIKQVEIEIIDRAWEEGWVTPQKPRHPHRQEGGRRRLRPGRAGRRPAAHPGRARRRRVRAGRPHRRAAALRHPRVQDGEGAARPQAHADARGGHALPRVRRRRHRHHRRAAAGGLRRRRAGGRGHRVARPAGQGPRGRGRPPGDGVPAVGQPRAAGRHRRAADHGGGQARRDHRRWRHRRRLPRHLAPPGCRVGHAAGDHAHAAGEAHRRHAVADLPDGLPGLLGARGGRRAAVLGQHHRVRRRRRGQAVGDPHRRGAARRVRAGSSPSRAPSRSCPRSWCCSPWASSARRRASCSPTSVWSSTSAATSPATRAT